MSEKIYKCLEIKDLKDMLKKSGEKYGEKNAYKIRLEKNKYKTKHFFFVFMNNLSIKMLYLLYHNHFKHYKLWKDWMY